MMSVIDTNLIKSNQIWSICTLGGLGTTWNKHYCMYTKENKILTMIPYTQTQGRLVSLGVLLLNLCCGS